MKPVLVENSMRLEEAYCIFSLNGLVKVSSGDFSLIVLKPCGPSKSEGTSARPRRISCMVSKSSDAGTRPRWPLSAMQVLQAHCVRSRQCRGGGGIVSSTHLFAKLLML